MGRKCFITMFSYSRNFQMVVVRHNIAEDTVLSNCPCLESYIFLPKVMECHGICENGVPLCIF